MPPLPGPLDVDVAIVGGGFTGLWTAYYVAKADPRLRVAVLEKEVVGFGASGRNGGWISPFFPASLETIEKHHGRDRALAMQRAMFDTVDEIGAVCAAEGIDARYHKGGVLNLATGSEQLARVSGDVDLLSTAGASAATRSCGSTPTAVRERIKVAGCLGAMYLTHCACLDPARVVRGLAQVVERLGVTIYEQTPVLSIENGKAVTAAGDVRAGVVVRGTEGFTPELPGARRDVIPTYSLMIATEPLPADFWSEVGWNDYETFTDGRHLYIYAMRTEDDRIALGGRGAPYHFHSKVRDEYERVDAVHSTLERVAQAALPGGARREGHAPLGRQPRDPARLVPVGRLRQGARLRLGRRLRRRRRRRLAHGRQDARRPDHRSRDGHDGAAVGQPRLAQVGARAAALDRRAHVAGGLRQRRQEGEEDRQAVQARRAHEEGSS